MSMPINAFHKGQRVNVPLGLECRMNGVIIDGPHVFDDETRAELYQEYKIYVKHYYRVSTEHGVVNSHLRHIRLGWAK